MNDPDLFEEPAIPGGARGGKRPGAGAKKGVKSDQATYKEYAEGRAKKEKFLAEQAELEFLKRSGALVPRDDVKRATATAFASISQTLRAIPDNLERKIALAPEIAEEVGRLIDDAMATLADDLEKLCRKSYE